MDAASFSEEWLVNGKKQAAAFGGGWAFLHHGLEILLCDRGEKSLQVADP
jgi:hypothetical protein